jgi:hypothetical protein
VRETTSGWDAITIQGNPTTRRRLVSGGLAGLDSVGALLAVPQRVAGLDASANRLWVRAMEAGDGRG